jgi:hypothetical protein
MDGMFASSAGRAHTGLPRYATLAAMDQPPAVAVVPARRRPFGVLVVALLQLFTVGIAMLGFFAHITIPWQGAFIRVLQDNGLARGAIVTFAVLVVVAAVGMWALRYWGWALMLTLVGLALVLDLTTWWLVSGPERDLPLYARMLLDVVCAFYLNSSAVQDAFRKTPHGDHMPAPVVATDSAGSTER